MDDSRLAQHKGHIRTNTSARKWPWAASPQNSSRPHGRSSHFCRPPTMESLPMQAVGSGALGVYRRLSFAGPGGVLLAGTCKFQAFMRRLLVVPSQSQFCASSEPIMLAFSGAHLSRRWHRPVPDPVLERARRIWAHVAANLYIGRRHAQDYASVRNEAIRPNTA